MENNLEEVIKRLDTLTVAVENNARELRKIRLHIFGKKRERPKTAEITFPDWCYEYQPMTVRLDAKEWKAVKDGKLITVRGQGEDISAYVKDGKPTTEWDYWTFNKDSPGHVYVVMGEEDSDWQTDVAYDGHLDACDILETEVAPKRIAKAK